MKIDSPKYHHTQSIWAALLCCLMAVSCTQEEELAAVGYLSLSGIEVSQTVEDMVGTRADIDLPIADAAPTADELTYTVVNKASNEAVYNNTGPWTGELTLTPGTYTIKAEYNENTFSQACFEGSTEITIAAGQHLTTENFKVSLKNALLQVKIDAELAEHFKEIQHVELTTSTASATVALNEWIFVPSGENITLTINGKNSAGNTATFTHTITPSPRTASIVTCTKDATNWPTITLPEQHAGAWNTRLYIDPATIGGEISEANQAKLVYEISTSSTDWTDATQATQIKDEYYYFGGLTNNSTYYVRARIGNITSEVRKVTVNEALSGVSVSAAHYNDGSGNLAGTDATLALGLTGILKTLKQEELLIIDTKLTNGSTTYRTATADGVMTASDGWPYIPQGTSYTLTVSQRLSTESSSISYNKTGITVPAPTFSVTLGNSYSSYDEGVGNNGIAKNVTNANKRDPHTIYNVSATGSVAAALMSNGNYSKTPLKLTLDGTEKTATNQTSTSYPLSNITGLTTWKAYELKATMTFDGVEASDAKTHHITGLPYTAAPPTNSGNHPWTHNDMSAVTSVEFNTDNVTMSATSVEPYIISPAFHIPANIPVKVSSRAQVNGRKYGLIWTTTNFISTIGGTQIFSQASGKQSGTTTYTPSGTGTLSSSNSTIKFESSYGASGPNIIIYSIDIIYQ